MAFLGYVYRFLSNFLLLAIVYFGLNAIEVYQQRAILAVIVLGYVATRMISSLRLFAFYRRLERLEAATRKLSGLTGEIRAARTAIVTEVADLRQRDEVKVYADLFFMGLIALLCAAKIVT